MFSDAATLVISYNSLGVAIYFFSSWIESKTNYFFFRSKILGGLGGIPSSNFMPENLSKIFLIILEIKTIFSI